ncbi:MAG: Crp/Fnr family transcriptional regulator [Dehalococcoidales bacterium]|nr:Crp/Fnr family transcriptional regulator [Dehalococcoidales bacterium]
MAVNTEILINTSYFKDLSDADITAITGRVFEKKAGRGEIVSLEGEPAEVLYFVTSGVIKVYKTSAEGKEQIYRIVRPGETFNDAAVLSHGTNLVTAEAMGPVELYGIKRPDMADIIAGYPDVARNTIILLSLQVQELVSLVEDFSFRHVTGRVAKMLLQYADHNGDERPRLTQQEMAALIGTAREMVGRSLKNLEEDGIITMERSRIVISDLEALKKLAGVDA